MLAEIIGGVLLGPTALGRNKAYMESVFPPQSIPLLETVATMGLMFFIFMVGLELDLQALGKAGKKALLIGVAGIGVPFAASAALASLVRSTVSQGVRLGPLIVFMGTPLSISAFSVLVRIMAELRLLSTDIGKLAVPSAAVNDVAVWTLLAVGVAIAGPKHNPLIPLWVLLCGAAYGLIMFTVVRMFMTIVAHRATKQGQGNDVYVCITLVAVLLAGFFSDAIGVHPLLGPFLLGLVIPKDNPFPKIITEKIEDFVTGLMLPLFFASSGLKTNLGSLHGVVSLGFLVLFFATAATGKIVGTFVAARLTGLPTRRALILGFLMNTKGLAVLIVLNIGRDLKALTDETFAILVLTCLLTSFVTFPVVSALCRLPGGIPGGGDADGSAYTGRNVESVEKEKQQLRILACADDNSHYAALVNLVEASRGSKKNTTSHLKLYTLRLIQLSERPSATLMLKSSAQQSSTNAAAAGAGNIILSFQASLSLSKVIVNPLTAISNLDGMHEDICTLAVEKRATIIIIPYHKPFPHAGLLSADVDDGFYKAYHKVLDNAPCSVGIVVDKASMGAASAAIHPCFFSYNVVVLFIGGPDDREALSLGCRMADHPGVALKVNKLTFNEEPNNQIYPNVDAKSPSFNLSEKNYELSPSSLDAAQERLLDSEAILKVKEKALECSLVYEEEHIVGGQSLIEAIKEMAKTEVNLFVVGRGRLRPRLTWCDDSYDSSTAECSELGIVGDVLATGEPDFHGCVLVVQQHRADLVAKSPSSIEIEN